ncbi:MAG: TMEM165/GDT1 family protein [Chloroflexota bacterium]
MEWGTLFSALGLIFVAELGDKTQLAVITQTCKFRRPLAVFLGASLALSLVTLIGAVAGQLLARVVPPGLLRGLAAGAFVVMGLLIAREALLKRGDGEACDVAALACDPAPKGLRALWDWRAFGSTLGLLFVAEMGDKTQLAVLSMAGGSPSPWLVFTGAAVALTAVTALGVLGGQGLCRIIPERTLLIVSAVAFVVMGVLMALGVLWPGPQFR